MFSVVGAEVFSSNLQITLYDVYQCTESQSRSLCAVHMSVCVFVCVCVSVILLHDILLYTLVHVYNINVISWLNNTTKTHFKKPFTATRAGTACYRNDTCRLLRG